MDRLLLTLAPELEAVSPGDRQTVEELALAQTSAAVFGAQQELAAAYLAAHILTLRMRGGDAGQITSKREGDLSVTYAHPFVRKALNSLEATSYGLERMRLNRVYALGFLV